MDSRTIVAPITGTAPAAVAVIRLSGADAWSIASRVFHPWPHEPTSHRAYYGRFQHQDDGIALLFAHGRSFTGEESVELSLHGSPASVRALLEACYAAGARPAEPGEFTLRAFMNGRIDLAQAEAIRDTVESLTAVQLQAAHSGREGALGDAIEPIVGQVGAVLAAIEASVDFSEEVGDLDHAEAIDRLGHAMNGLDALLAHASAGRLLREGMSVAIVGAPNAGKSSLLNALLGYRRAIVTDIAGTTRDTIEELVDLGGIPVRFIDTAGFRETEDTIEAEGIARSQAAVQSADLVLEVIDLQHPRDIGVRGKRHLRVGNKLDVCSSEVSTDVSISAQNGTHVPQLIDAIRAVFLTETEGLTVALNHRHVPLLTLARDAAIEARTSLALAVPPDLAVTHLRDALHHLGLVTGSAVTVDYLDLIFKNFCIGK